MDKLKKHLPILLITLLMVGMAVVIFLTTQKLGKTTPVAPNVPQVKPKASTPACTLTFSIAKQCNTACTEDAQCGTGYCDGAVDSNARFCRNRTCPTDTNCVCAGTPTPTPTATSSPTSTPANTSTPTPTSTPGPTSTPTPTRNPSQSPTSTPSTQLTATSSPTSSPTPSPLAQNPSEAPVPKVPVAGSGPGTLGALIIAAGTILLLVGFAF